MAGNYHALDGSESVRRRATSGLYCCACCICCIFTTCAVFTAISRNNKCNPEALKDLEVPFDGQIIPAEVLMLEQSKLFQLTKQVDVFAGNDSQTPVGSFYDMNFYLWMSFGFSDSSGNVWFEAVYPSFFSRFKIFLEFQLQRCDGGDIYLAREDWWKKSWFCWNTCRRVFDITLQNASTGVASPVAHVEFNAVSKWWGYAWRPQWFMNFTEIQQRTEAAYAKQHFFWGGVTGYSILSNWTVDVYKPVVPNWVVAFMAALDDIEENEG